MTEVAFAFLYLIASIVLVSIAIVIGYYSLKFLYYVLVAPIVFLFK